MLDAGSEQVLAQIAAAEAARDWRFASMLARGVPRACRWLDLGSRQTIALAAILTQLIGVIAGSLLLTVAGGLLLLGSRYRFHRA